jgi:hypothetical protein
MMELNQPFDYHMRCGSAPGARHRVIHTTVAHRPDPGDTGYGACKAAGLASCRQESPQAGAGPALDHQLTEPAIVRKCPSAFIGHSFATDPYGNVVARAADTATLVRLANR